MLHGLLPDGAPLAAFAGAVLMLSLTPGPDMLLTVTRTLQGGRRAGAAAAFGILAGSAVHTATVALGAAALLLVVPGAFAALQWAGAAYLLWLGAGLLRQAWRGDGTMGGEDAAAGARATASRRPPRPLSRSLRADFRAGLLTNVLNPKVALFFLAFLPPFVPAGTPSTAASLALLGAWFVVQNLFYMLGLVWLATRLRRLGVSVAWRRALQTLAGGLFVALAAGLLRQRVN